VVVCLAWFSVSAFSADASCGRRRPQIWSVGLAADGSFAGDAIREIDVPPAAGPTEISKITFDDKGRMLLAERAARRAGRL
jgi:hypothetical protein